MDQTQKFYKERTIGLLTQFQLLELSLKLYIGKAYDLIHHVLDGKVYFGYSIEDVESYPLERLLNIFQKLNENNSLQARLNKLRKERNYIAHEALIVSIGKNPNMETLHKKAEEYFYLEDELTECISLLTSELRALSYHLNTKESDNDL